MLTKHSCDIVKNVFKLPLGYRYTIVKMSLNCPKLS